MAIHSIDGCECQCYLGEPNPVVERVQYVPKMHRRLDCHRQKNPNLSYSVSNRIPCHLQSQSTTFDAAQVFSTNHLVPINSLREYNLMFPDWNHWPPVVTDTRFGRAYQHQNEFPWSTGMSIRRTLVSTRAMRQLRRTPSAHMIDLLPFLCSFIERRNPKWSMVDNRENILIRELHIQLW